MRRQPDLQFSVFLIGFCGLVAQVAVLREMVVTFYGNELSIGVMLGAWLLWTGLGSLGLGRLARRLARPRLALSRALLGGALLLVATVAAARALKIIVGLGQEAPLGQIRPFGMMVTASFALLGPFCLLNGFLFPLACRAAAVGSDESGVGRVYLLEAAGAAVGGAMYSFALVHWLNPLALAFALAATWCAMACWGAETRPGRVVAAVAGLALAATAVIGWPAALARRLDTAYWHPLALLSTQDSRYGRSSVVAHSPSAAQRSLYRSGALAFSYPDQPQAEGQVHLPMLEHPSPRRVLLLGGALGGALAEVLKHPSVTHVTCVELDPVIVEAVRREFPPGAVAPLADPRVELVLADGRAFLKRAAGRYDVVIAAEGPPTTAQANRFYTQEFFAEVARVLEPGGVLSFRVAGGHNYIPEHTRRLLACLYHTLRCVFQEAIVFSGGECTFLASNRSGVVSHDLDVLAEQMARRGLETSYVDPSVWMSDLMGGRLEELEAALEEAPPLNRDLAPRCYYYEALRWSAVQRPRGSRAEVSPLDLGRILAFLARWPAVAPLALLGIVLAVAVLAPLVWWRWRDAMLGGAIAATGLTEMALEIVVLLGFQVVYGYVYQYVGILVASFMLGVALGGWASSRWVARGRASWGRLLAVQGLIVVYPLLLLALLVIAEGAPPAASALVAAAFTLAATVAGAAGGLQFPLATALHSRGDASAGPLYGLDLFGSCLGALAVSSVLVPTFGFVAVCLMLSALGALGLAGIAAAGWRGGAKSS